MKYVWIVMLIIAEIIWFIFSLKDFIETIRIERTRREIKIARIFDSLEGYTDSYIILHLCLLFTYSLTEFIEGLM